jgi:hypothetical protein
MAARPSSNLAADEVVRRQGVQVADGLAGVPAEAVLSEVEDGKVGLVRHGLRTRRAHTNWTVRSDGRQS